MKKILLVVVMLVVFSCSVLAWDPNPTYNPFEVIWNYLANVSTSWKDGPGKVTTNVSVGIGTSSPSEKLTVEGTIESTSGGFKFPDGSVQTSGNLKQLLQDFVVASGENITAGDVVSFLNGYVQKGRIGQGNTISYGSQYVFNANAFSTSAVALTSTKFVVAYRDAGNSYYGTAVVGDVSENTITYGTEYVFNSANSQYTSAAVLSSNKFVVVYEDMGNSQYGTAVIGDVSGNTITYGLEYVFNTDTTQRISIAALTPTKFVVTIDHDDSGNTRAAIGNVSGSAISFGSHYEFHTGGSTVMSVAAFSPNKFVVAYRGDDNDGYPGTAIIGNVSGTTITYGSKYVFNSGRTEYISAAALSSNKFVVAYRDDGNSDYGTAVIGDVSGNNITYGSEYVFNSANTLIHSVAALSSTKFVVAYRDDGNSYYSTVVIGGVSDNTITYGLEYVFNSAIPQTISAAALSSNKFVAADGNIDHGTAIIGYVHYGNIIGIAKESKTSNQTVPVIVSGVSDVHSGLIQGAVYYSDTYGNLTIHETDHMVGLALSSTDVLLDNSIYGS